MLFPLLLSIMGRKARVNSTLWKPDESLPFVSILMAVHNEEAVIIEKLRSVFQSDYPEERFELLVGSDNSTDKTNDILMMYANDHPALRCFLYDQRTGKPGVINNLYREARGEILVMTDANVYFRKDTLFHLVKHFKNSSIGLVGANIVNSRREVNGISIQEWTFLVREIKMKHWEGRIWGAMIGAEGGCYAVRNELYVPVPEGFAVDDFFITMKVLEKKFDSILEMDAVCYEDVSNDLGEAFRRKVRISSGNFRNLREFGRLLWPPCSGLSFSFFSHKVLRWLGPFLLLIILATNIPLWSQGYFYRATLIFQLAILGMIILDFLLRKIRLHIVFLRFITHFYSMNLALLLGFFKYLNKAETDVWEPTRRSKYT
jgi:cellulose synthase/poly-beta-1,6-N-acetylglucosamine synthase-like glycosyltransferase